MSTNLRTKASRSGPPIRSTHSERGQGTAEYALLLLGAATIALVVLSWATGTGKIGALLDAVVDSIIARV